NVQLSGSTGLNADGRAIQFLGTFHAQLVVGQEAHAVVIGDETRKFQAHARIARAGHGGVTRQYVDFTGLQRGETLLGVQLTEFDLGRIAEYGSGHSAADVSVDPEDLASCVRYRENRPTIAYAALYETFH